MADSKIGIIEKRYEDTEFEWKITDFFNNAENKCLIRSPSFHFAGNTWKFSLCRSLSRNRDCMFLYFQRSSDFAFSVECTFGLKNVNGCVERLYRRIWEKDTTNNVAHSCSIKLSEIQQRKSELAPTDVLIIIGTLKRIIENSDQPRALKIPENKKLIKLDALSENFKNLFLSKCNCDATLCVANKEYKVHKVVLMARSSVFHAMFLHDTVEKQTGIVTIPDCEPESFQKFLEFLYCGKLEKLSSRDALHLYETSNKYDIQELKTFCVEYLMENLNIANVCEIAIMADKYDEANLLRAAQKFFNKCANEIVDTSEWDSLVENNNGLSKKLLKGAFKKLKTECC